MMIISYSRFLLIFLIFLSCTLFVEAAGRPHGPAGNHSNYVDREYLRDHIKEHLKNEHAKNVEQSQHSESPHDDDANQHEADEFEDINVDEMDEKEELYYLFSLHDYNHDGYLDGHELRLAFTDFDEEDHGHTEAILDLAEVEEMIDHALEEDDKDGDGKISMEEYIESETYHML